MRDHVGVDTPTADQSSTQRSTALPHLVEMVVATTRYLGDLSELQDSHVRAPSLLPRWSRGHVITHLARNADALCNLLHGAEAGEERYMYESREQRDADIEAGAGRSAHELRMDSSASAGRLVQALNELDVRHEDVPVARMAGTPPFPAREIPTMRLVEVMVHHTDLDIGFTHREWDRPFCELVLDQMVEDRAQGPAAVLRASDSDRMWRLGVPGQGPTVEGRSCDLAWWALGRGHGQGLTSDSDVLPELGPWR